MKRFWMIFFCSFSYLFSDEVVSNPAQTLFVSLGSTCEPAHMLRFSELRTQAFPFDWITSFDGNALIEMLENGFDGYFDDVHFAPYGPAGHLKQAKYHLEFLHEGNFNLDYRGNLEKLKDKYARRIQRFIDLNDREGKVFFLRNAYIYAATDPHRFYKFEENLEITDDAAVRLHQALEKRFPKLNFELIVINCGEGEGITEERRFAEGIRVYRAYPHHEQATKIDNYKKFFNQLLAESP